MVLYANDGAVMNINLYNIIFCGSIFIIIFGLIFIFLFLHSSPRAHHTLPCTETKKTENKTLDKINAADSFI